jgi:hypothetical protein
VFRAISFDRCEMAAALAQTPLRFFATHLPASASRIDCHLFGRENAGEFCGPSSALVQQHGYSGEEE